MKSLISYLEQRPEAMHFLLPTDLDRTLRDLFTQPDILLPHPMRIYPADETQEPILGFPVAESALMKDLDTKLDRWLAEETLFQVTRATDAKEKAQIAFNVYIGNLMKAAENALMSNLLSDYHAIFWLAHSFDLARHFGGLPRRISTIDVQAGRTLGDTLK